MKIVDFLIIAFLLFLLTENKHALAFGRTLKNIKALRDWSNEVYKNFSEIDPTKKSMDLSAYISLEINNKLRPKMDRSSTTTEQIVHSRGCSLMQYLPALHQCNEALDNLAMNLDIIDRFNHNLEMFVKNDGRINNFTLKRWAESITSNSVGNLPDILWKIRRSIVPEYDFHEGLFMLISRTLQKNNDDICDIGIPPQHCVYELYQTILDRQIKAYVMTLYAYDYLQIFGNGNFSTEMNIVRDEFDEMTKKLMEVVFESMKEVPQDLRRCDPKEHKRNSTFLELERLMQAYIVYKADINSLGKCNNDCSLLQKNVIQKQQYDNRNFKHNRACDGDLIWCNDGGSNLTVCELPKDSVRRYAWFKDENDFHGVETNCNDGKISKLSSWMHYSTKCNYCICTCIQDKVGKDMKTIRTISFMDQMSNIIENMVVVGLRFVSKFGVIHIQILQALLLAEGGLDMEKSEWLPIEVFYYLPKASEEIGQNRYHIWIDNGETCKSGKHYGAINRNQRQINLDDILLPEDYVVTGVRFRHSEGQSGHQPIRLEVHGTPFNYAFGKLIPTEEKSSMWFTAENMKQKGSDSFRREVKLQNPGNPLNYVGHVQNSKPNSYIKFTTTDIKKDAGQATVPFFDAQQIGGEMSSPLSGIGIFHRGHPTSGGFLAFRIYGLNLTKYMNVAGEEYVEPTVYRVI